MDKVNKCPLQIRQRFFIIGDWSSQATSKICRHEDVLPPTIEPEACMPSVAQSCIASLNTKYFHAKTSKDRAAACRHLVYVLGCVQKTVMNCSDEEKARIQSKLAFTLRVLGDNCEYNLKDFPSLTEVFSLGENPCSYPGFRSCEGTETTVCGVHRKTLSCYETNIKGCNLWQNAPTTLGFTQNLDIFTECSISFNLPSPSNDPTLPAYQCLRVFHESLQKVIPRPSHGVIDLCRKIDAFSSCVSDAVMADGFPHVFGQALMYPVSKLVAAASGRCQMEKEKIPLVCNQCHNATDPSECEEIEVCPLSKRSCVTLTDDSYGTVTRACFNKEACRQRCQGKHGVNRKCWQCCDAPGCNSPTNTTVAEPISFPETFLPVIKLLPESEFCPVADYAECIADTAVSLLTLGVFSDRDRTVECRRYTAADIQKCAELVRLENCSDVVRKQVETTQGWILQLRAGVCHRPPVDVPCQVEAAFSCVQSHAYSAIQHLIGGSDVCELTETSLAETLECIKSETFTCSGFSMVRKSLESVLHEVLLYTSKGCSVNIPELESCKEDSKRPWYNRPWDKSPGGDTKEGGKTSGGNTKEGGTTKEGGKTPGGKTKEGGKTPGGKTKEGGKTPGGKTKEGGKTPGGKTKEGGKTPGGKTKEGGKTPGGKTKEGGKTPGGKTKEGGKTPGGKTKEGGKTPGGKTKEGGKTPGGKTKEGGKTPGGKTKEGGTTKGGGKTPGGKTGGKTKEGGKTPGGKTKEGGRTPGGKTKEGGKSQGGGKSERTRKPEHVEIPLYDKYKKRMNCDHNKAAICVENFKWKVSQAVAGAKDWERVCGAIPNVLACVRETTHGCVFSERLLVESSLLVSLEQAHDVCANITLPDRCERKEKCHIRRAVDCIKDLKDLLIEDDNEDFADTDVLCRQVLVTKSCVYRNMDDCGPLEKLSIDEELGLALALVSDQCDDTIDQCPALLADLVDQILMVEYGKDSSSKSSGGQSKSSGGYTKGSGGSTKGSGGKTKGSGSKTKGSGGKTKDSDGPSKGSGGKTKGSGGKTKGSGGKTKGSGGKTKGSDGPSKGSGGKTKGSDGPSKGSGGKTKGSGGKTKDSGGPSKGSGGKTKGSGGKTKGSGGKTKGSVGPSKGSGGHTKPQSKSRSSSKDYSRSRDREFMELCHSAELSFHCFLERLEDIKDHGMRAKIRETLSGIWAFIERRCHDRDREPDTCLQHEAFGCVLGFLSKSILTTYNGTLCIDHSFDKIELCVRRSILKCSDGFKAEVRSLVGTFQHVHEFFCPVVPKCKADLASNCLQSFSSTLFNLVENDVMCRNLNASIECVKENVEHCHSEDLRVDDIKESLRFLYGIVGYCCSGVQFPLIDAGEFCNVDKMRSCAARDKLDIPATANNQFCSELNSTTTCIERNSAGCLSIQGALVLHSEFNSYVRDSARVCAAPSDGLAPLLPMDSYRPFVPCLAEYLDAGFSGNWTSPLQYSVAQCSALSVLAKCLDDNSVRLPNLVRDYLGFDHSALVYFVASECKSPDQPPLTCYRCHRATSNSECNEDMQVCPHNKQACETLIHRKNDGKVYISKGCKNPNACKSRTNGSGKKTWHCCDNYLCNRPDGEPLTTPVDVVVVQEPATCDLNAVSRCWKTSSLQFWFSSVLPYCDVGVCYDLQRTEYCLFRRLVTCSESTQKYFLDEIEGAKIHAYELCKHVPQLPEEPSCAIASAEACVHSFRAKLGYSLANDELCLSVNATLECVRLRTALCEDAQREAVALVYDLLRISLSVVGRACVYDPLPPEVKPVCMISDGKECMEDFVYWFMNDRKETDDVCSQANDTYRCITETTAGCNFLQVAPLVSNVKLYLTELELDCPDPPKPQKEDELTELHECTETLGVELAAALQNPLSGTAGMCALIIEFRECLEGISGGQKLVVITEEVDKLTPIVNNIWKQLCQEVPDPDNTTLIPPEQEPDSCKLKKATQCITSQVYELVAYGVTPIDDRLVICGEYESVRECVETSSYNCSDARRDSFTKAIKWVEVLTETRCEQECVVDDIFECSAEFATFLARASLEGALLREQICPAVEFAWECVNKYVISCNAELSPLVATVRGRIQAAVETIGDLCEEPKECNVDAATKCLQPVIKDVLGPGDEDLCRDLTSGLKCVDEMTAGCKYEELSSLPVIVDVIWAVAGSCCPTATSRLLEHRAGGVCRFPGKEQCEASYMETSRLIDSGADKSELCPSINNTLRCSTDGKEFCYSIQIAVKYFHRLDRLFSVAESSCGIGHAHIGLTFSPLSFCLFDFMSEIGVALQTDPSKYRDFLCVNLHKLKECYVQRISILPPVLQDLFHEASSFLRQFTDRECTNTEPPLSCYTCHKSGSNDDCNQESEVCPFNKQACETVIDSKVSGQIISKGCKNPNACKSRTNGRKTWYCCHDNLCNQPAGLPLTSPLPVTDIAEPATCDLAEAVRCVGTVALEVMFNPLVPCKDRDQVCLKLWNAEECVTLATASCSGLRRHFLSTIYYAFRERTEDVCKNFDPSVIPPQETCAIAAAELCVSELSYQLTAVDLASDKRICVNVNMTVECVRARTALCVDAQKEAVSAVYDSLRIALSIVGEACVYPALPPEVRPVCELGKGKQCVQDFVSWFTNERSGTTDVCSRVDSTYDCITQKTAECNFLQVAPLAEEVKLYLTEIELECANVTEPKPQKEDELTELHSCTQTLGEELAAALQNPSRGYSGMCVLVVDFRECLEGISAGQKVNVISDEIQKLIPVVHTIWDKFCSIAIEPVNVTLIPIDQEPPSCNVKRASQCIKSEVYELVAFDVTPIGDRALVCSSYKSVRDCVTTSVYSCSGPRKSSYKEVVKWLGVIQDVRCKLTCPLNEATQCSVDFEDLVSANETTADSVCPAYEVAVDCLRFTASRCDFTVVNDMITQLEKRIETAKASLGDLCKPPVCDIDAASRCVLDVFTVVDPGATLCQGIAIAGQCVLDYTVDCYGDALNSVAGFRSQLSTLNINYFCTTPPITTLTSCFHDYQMMVREILINNSTLQRQHFCQTQIDKVICFNSHLSRAMANNREFNGIIRAGFKQIDLIVKEVCTSTVIYTCPVDEILGCMASYLGFIESKAGTSGLGFCSSELNAQLNCFTQYTSSCTSVSDPVTVKLVDIWTELQDTCYPPSCRLDEARSCISEVKSMFDNGDNVCSDITTLRTCVRDAHENCTSAQSEPVREGTDALATLLNQIKNRGDCDINPVRCFSDLWFAVSTIFTTDKTSIFRRSCVEARRTFSCVQTWVDSELVDANLKNSVKVITTSLVSVMETTCVQTVLPVPDNCALRHILNCTQDFVVFLARQSSIDTNAYCSQVTAITTCFSQLSVVCPSQTVFTVSTLTAAFNLVQQTCTSCDQGVLNRCIEVASGLMNTSSACQAIENAETCISLNFGNCPAPVVATFRGQVEAFRQQIDCNKTTPTEHPDCVTALKCLTDIFKEMTVSRYTRHGYCGVMERARACTENLDLGLCTRVREDINRTLAQITSSSPDCNIPLCQVQGTSECEMSEGQTRMLEIKCTEDPALYCEDGLECVFDIAISFSQINGTMPRCTLESNKTIIPQLVVGYHGNYFDSSYCGIRVNSTNWEETFSVPITAVADGKYDDRQDWQVGLTMKKYMTSIGGKPSIYSAEIETNFQCAVFDMDRRVSTCSIIADPHFVNFDGSYFNVYKEAEYVLYKHDSGLYEVHGFFQACGEDGSCTCAAFVRSGDDVFVVDICEREDNSTFDLLDYTLYKNQDLTPGTIITSENDNKVYKIVLPTGTLVQIELTMGKYLNVWIRASPYDWSATTGLCGVYDGNSTNDLTMANGTLFVPENEDERFYPNIFSDTWRVFDEDSYIEGVEVSNSQAQQQNRYCSCSSTYLSGDTTPDVCEDFLQISTCDLSINPDFKTQDFVESAIESLFTRQKRQVGVVSRRRGRPRADLNYNPPFPAWPSNGWILQDATVFCNDFLFLGFGLSRDCAMAFPDLNLGSSLQSCVDDIQVTGGTGWAMSSWANVRFVCEQEAQKTVVVSVEVDVYVQQVINNRCYQNCSNHGQCINGVCDCDEGYVGSDCSVTAPPSILVIEEGYICDLQTSVCSTVTVRGTSFVNRASLTCGVRSVKVSSTGVSLPTNNYSQRRAVFRSFSKVECEVFTQRSSLEAVLVSVRNSGNMFGTEQFFMQFDSSCYTCENRGNSAMDIRCTIKPYTCDIDGQCYQAGQSRSASEPFLQCQPTRHQYVWTDMSPPGTTQGPTPCERARNCVTAFASLPRSSRKSVLCSGADTAVACLQQLSTQCSIIAALQAELNAYIDAPNIECRLPNFLFASSSTEMHIEEGEQLFIEFKLEEAPALFCNGSDDCEILIHVNVDDRDVVGQVENRGILRCKNSGRVVSQLVVGELGEEACALRISASNWNQRQLIPILGRVDNVYDGLRIVDLSLVAEKIERGASVLTKTIKSIEVYVEDQVKRNFSTCAIINDPHAVTFDGRFFNVFMEGEFIVYQHKKLPYSVHAVFQRCAPSGFNATCTCAVMVKAENDVFIVNRCRMKELGDLIAQTVGIDASEVPLMTLAIVKRGNLRPFNDRPISSSLDGKQFNVVLPHGGLVQIQVTQEFFNVWISPSVLDFGQSQGLCGNYTGDKFDDLFFRNGTDYQPTINGSALRSIRPDEMSKSWRVTAEESLLQGVQVVGDPLPPQTHCTCPQRGGSIDLSRACERDLLVETCNLDVGSERRAKDLVYRAMSTTVVKRKKRAVVEPLLNLLDVDYDYQPESYSAWPTRSGWTEDTATEYCENYLNQSSEMTKLCSQLADFNFEVEMRSCVEDIQISDGVLWALPALESIRTRCVGEIDRDFTPTDTNLVSDIRSKACPSMCSNHGRCENGICVCDEGYEEFDCSLDSTASPILARFQDFETSCESSQNNCTILTVQGRNFARTNGIVCNIEEIDVASNGDIIRPGVTRVSRPATFLTFESVQCDIKQTLPVARRPILVSVSNKHGAVSRPLAYMVYHEDCYSCDPKLRCTRKRDTCVIDGQCYIKNEPKPNERCKRCDPDVMDNQWTYNEACSKTPVSGGNTDNRTQDIVMVASVSTAALVMVVILIGVIAFVRRHRNRRSKSKENLMSRSTLGLSTGFSGTAVGMSPDFDDSERTVWTPNSDETVDTSSDPVQMRSAASNIVLDKYGGYRQYASRGTDFTDTN